MLALFLMTMLVADPAPVMSDPGCLNDLKAANTANFATLTATGDASTACKALPAATVQLLVKQARVIYEATHP